MYYITGKQKRNTNLDKKEERQSENARSKDKEGFKNMRQTRDWENRYITQKNRYPMHTPYGAYGETVTRRSPEIGNASRFCNGSERRLEIQNVSVTGSGGSIFYEEEFRSRSMGYDSGAVQLGIAGIWKAGLHQYAVSVQTGRQTAKHLRSRLSKAPTS